MHMYVCACISNVHETFVMGVALVHKGDILSINFLCFSSQSIYINL